MKKGFGLIIAGIVICLLAYPLTSWLFSQDAVLVKYSIIMTLSIIAFGLGFIITGILTLKFKEKMRWYYKLILIIVSWYLLSYIIGFIVSKFIILK